MIVRIARVKVGNRQASYAVRPEPRLLQKRAGVLAFTCLKNYARKNASLEQNKAQTKMAVPKDGRFAFNFCIRSSPRAQLRYLLNSISRRL
jgi:hypothetical protein